MVMTTCAPGTAVPVMVGMLLLSTAPLAGPLMSTAVSESTVKADVAVAVLPTRSVATAVMVCGPLRSASMFPMNHVPSTATVTRPTSTPSMETTTSAPGSPVPRSSGEESKVVLPSAGSTIATTVMVSTLNPAVVHGVHAAHGGLGDDGVRAVIKRRRERQGPLTECVHDGGAHARAIDDDVDRRAGRSRTGDGRGSRWRARLRRAGPR
jgi:hypothetical protein